jgi:putative addiction module component (TIGR02574 family)
MAIIDMDAIRQLSVAERVRLAQDIWDSLRPLAEQLPLTEEQGELVRRRLAEHHADPSSAIPWEEAEERLRGKL